MRYQGLALAALAALAAGAAAQTPEAPSIGFEILPIVGVYVPTGVQRDNFKSNVLVGGELGYAFTRHFTARASFDWVPQTVKFTGLTTDGADLYQYDLGVEYNLRRTLRNGTLLRPFVGVGGGGRTYHYAAGSAPSGTTGEGYGVLGVEWLGRRYGLRLEARDNVSSYGSPIPSARKTTNDVTISVGLAYRFGTR